MRIYRTSLVESIAVRRGVRRGRRGDAEDVAAAVFRPTPRSGQEIGLEISCNGQWTGLTWKHVGEITSLYRDY